jgi:lysophospholipase L1-like esterase
VDGAVSGGRARGLLANLALGAVSVILALLLAEGAVRALGLTPRRLANTARIGDARGRLRLDCYPDNPRGYFDIDLRDPATRARYREQGVGRVDAVAARAPFAVEFRFNELGFRDAEWGPRPAGVRRVIVVGDSFTEGWGVKEADTYPRVLERLLQAAEPGAWEVRNAGRRGADFPALRAQFEEALRHQPDLVVYGLVLNDAERSPEFQARQQYLNDWIFDQEQVEAGRPVRSPGPLGSRLWWLVEDRLESRRIGAASTRWYRDMYTDANRDGWARTQDQLRDIQREATARGARFLVASWPLLVDLDRYPFAEAHETVARFCQSAGIARHDLLPALRGQRAEALIVNPADRHPNEIAQRLAAESLAPAVRAALGTF